MRSRPPRAVVARDTPSPTPAQLHLDTALTVPLLCCCWCCPQVQTVEAPTAEPTTQAAEQQDGLADIYVGKGRYVKDDPKKYPGKDNLGPLIGAAGETHCRHGASCTGALPHPQLRRRHSV